MYRAHVSVSPFLLLSPLRIVQSTHIVRAEPYDREVVAVVQFHSWYHFGCPPRHATPRRTSQKQLLARWPTTNCRPLRALSHSACPRSLITRQTHTATGPDSVFFLVSLSLCLAPSPYLIFDLFHGYSTISSRLTRQLRATR